MSNDLILSIKNTLAKVGVDEETRAVAGKGGGGGSKRISIKGACSASTWGARRLPLLMIVT